MFQDHFTTATRLPSHIVNVEPAKKIVQAITKAGPVYISVYTTGPFFRWPVVGENWLIRSENGNWYLDSILQDENDSTLLTELGPGDSGFNISGKIYTNTGTTLTQKYKVEVGDGVNEEFVIKHGLKDLTVSPSAIESKSPYAAVSFTWKVKDENSITVKFSTKIAENSVIVIVIG